MSKKWIALLLALLLGLSLLGCSPSGTVGTQNKNENVNLEELTELNEEGSYTSKEDVAEFLWVYGYLPDNFMTKKEAQALGWSGGSLEPYAPGCCIGGDRFGNYEGLLPEGPEYTECDIDTMGQKSRGAKRIVFSSDGYIYYTDDHYESFTVLWFTDALEMKEAEVE